MTTYKRQHLIDSIEELKLIVLRNHNWDDVARRSHELSLLDIEKLLKREKLGEVELK